MDSAAPYLTDRSNDTAAGQVLGLVSGLVDAAGWLYNHWYLLALAMAVCWGWASWWYVG